MAQLQKEMTRDPLHPTQRAAIKALHPLTRYACKRLAAVNQRRIRKIIGLKK
jgi:hypothetical protein